MTTITIEFHFNEVNESTMSAKVGHSNKEDIITGSKGTVIYRDTIIMPTILSIEFFGKNMDTDTILNESGKITKDKYVAIKSIALDGIELSYDVLYNMIKFYDDNQTLCRYKYVGLNSKMSLELDRKNAFFQIADLERRAKTLIN